MRHRGPTDEGVAPVVAEQLGDPATMWRAAAIGVLIAAEKRSDLARWGSVVGVSLAVGLLVINVAP